METASLVFEWAAVIFFCLFSFILLVWVMKELRRAQKRIRNGWDK